jgi:riboflavin kinase/FMN adenylyltransferase
MTNAARPTLLRHLDGLPDEFRRGAVAIGNFDGVHRGHACLIERLIARARAVRGPAVVFTFDPHPVQLLRPDAAPPPLTWAERKAELLGELGVDAVIAYPTDEALLRLSAQEFFARVIRAGLQAQALVEGANFCFGRNRSGDVRILGDYCAAAGILLEIVEPLSCAGAIVSSSRVRERIQAGDVDAARTLLTRPYRVRGLVTHGARRGSTLGFPTANVSAVDTLVPGLGVYAGSGVTPSGNWPAAISIGPNPTFGEHGGKFEVHLIGYSGSLYGQPLEVDFLARLRDIHPFGSAEELKHQLAQDRAAAQQIAESQGA